MKPHHTLAAILLIVALFALSQSVFTVDQTQQAIVLQFGQPVGNAQGPGLHFKLPLVQDAVFFERRTLSVDPPPAQVVISSSMEVTPADKAGAAAAPDNSRTVEDALASGEPIIVDTFARYDITDPLKFLKTMRTVDVANHRLESILNDATRAVLGKTTLRQLLSPERNAAMKDILDRMNKKVQDDQLGINIVDIRIVRADLTPELRQATVQRMISALQERAKKTRSEGEQEATQIRASADKESKVIQAEAQRDAQITRGEGDQLAIKIYADAFNKDKEFYDFTRSLEAYRTSFANADTRLILSPDSEFLRYFKNGPDAGGGTAAKP